MKQNEWFFLLWIAVGLLVGLGFGLLFVRATPWPWRIWVTVIGMLWATPLVMHSVFKRGDPLATRIWVGFWMGFWATSTAVLAFS